jgi:hypothetical protein
MVELAGRSGDVPVVEITSREDEDNAKCGLPRKLRTTALICRHISGRDDYGEPLPDHPVRGHLLFITHESFHRMGGLWPQETREFKLVIDEVPEVILTRQPFRLPDSCHVLTSFLEVEEVWITPMSRRARRR